MKKLFALSTAALMLCTCLTACGGSDANNDAGNAGGATTTNLLEKIQQRGQLKVALSPDFAPMEFIDTSKSGQEQYVGFDVTLANYIANELGVELVIEPMEFSVCQGAVQTKTVDMSISGYSVTPERAENFDLSDGYYTDNESSQCVMVKLGEGANYTTVEDFAGKTLGAQNGSLQYNLLTSQLPDASPYVVSDLNTGVLDLTQGNIDGLVVSGGNGKAIMANNENKFEFAQWEFDVDDDANVVLIPKGETELLEAVNAALAKALEAGYYPEWYAEAMELAGLDTAAEVTVGASDAETAE